MTQCTILVINSGSSSIKYQLADPDSSAPFASGLVERIGEEIGAVTHRHGKERAEITEPVLDHGFGLSGVLRLLEKQGPSLAGTHIMAVDHRIVQGGHYFSDPALVGGDVVAQVEQLVPLGPLHNPIHLKGIKVGCHLLFDIPCVAVFDTAFFQDPPEEAARHALNCEVADTYSIRRYGTHGTSHQFVSEAVSELLGCDDLEQAVLHLGSGASASAAMAEHAVNTSMGLTPLKGLVMGGRTGDIDPVAVFHLAHAAGMSIDEIDHLFNRGSGMEGLARDNSVREVWKHIGADEQEAREAMDAYLHRLVRYVGAYTAVMGGLDALTFTADIGGNDASLRRRLDERLGFMGVKINQEVNETRSDKPHIVSTPGSKVATLVMPTNEGLAIMRQALTLI